MQTLTPIRAIYEGVQEYPGHAPFELWTILEEIEGHPELSTLSLNTLHSYGLQPVRA